MIFHFCRLRFCGQIIKSLLLSIIKECVSHLCSVSSSFILRCFWSSCSWSSSIRSFSVPSCCNRSILFSCCSRINTSLMLKVKFVFKNFKYKTLKNSLLFNKENSCPCDSCRFKILPKLLKVFKKKVVHCKTVSQTSKKFLKVQV